MVCFVLLVFLLKQRQFSYASFTLNETSLCRNHRTAIRRIRDFMIKVSTNSNGPFPPKPASDCNPKNGFGTQCSFPWVCTGNEQPIGWCEITL